MAKINKTRLSVVIIFLIALLASTIYGCSIGKEKAPTPVEKKIEQKEITAIEGKAKIVDLKNKSKEMFLVVDKYLQSKKTWEVNEDSRKEKSSIQSGLDVQWLERATLVRLPKGEEFLSALEQFEEYCKANKLLIIKRSEEKYDGKEVTRFLLGTNEKVGKELVQISTEEIYFMPLGIKKVETTKKGKLAIIVDDCGYNMDPVRKMTAIEQKITFAALPYKDFTVEAAELIRARGKELLLHLPMEPMNKSAQSEAKTIEVGMTSEQISSNVTNALHNIGRVDGVNNHQGSRATSDEKIMREVIKVLSAQGVFFVDSNTYPQTVGHKIAREMGVRTALNNIFLDGDADPDVIRRRFREAGKLAIANGQYIAICHARGTTALVFAEMVQELDEMGVELVFVSSLLS